MIVSRSLPKTPVRLVAALLAAWGWQAAPAGGVAPTEKTYEILLDRPRTVGERYYIEMQRTSATHSLRRSQGVVRNEKAEQQLVLLEGDVAVIEVDVLGTETRSRLRVRNYVVDDSTSCRMVLPPRALVDIDFRTMTFTSAKHKVTPEIETDLIHVFGPPIPPTPGLFGEDAPRKLQEKWRVPAHRLTPTLQAIAGQNARINPQQVRADGWLADLLWPQQLPCLLLESDLYIGELDYNFPKRAGVRMDRASHHHRLVLHVPINARQQMPRRSFQFTSSRVVSQDHDGAEVTTIVRTTHRTDIEYTRPAPKLFAVEPLPPPNPETAAPPALPGPTTTGPAVPPVLPVPPDNPSAPEMPQREPGTLPPGAPSPAGSPRPPGTNPVRRR